MDEMTLEEMLDYIEGDEQALSMDGFDDCICGLGTVGGSWVLIYDQEKVLDKLMQQGMSYTDAVEYHSFNQTGYMGPGTPIIQEFKIVK